MKTYLTALMFITMLAGFALPTPQPSTSSTPTQKSSNSPTFNPKEIDCSDNLNRYVKCMKLSPHFDSKDRFNLDKNDCYGMIAVKCMENYCKEERYRPIREYKACKYWLFGCTTHYDEICGRILSLLRWELAK